MMVRRDLLVAHFKKLIAELRRRQSPATKRYLTVVGGRR